MGKNSVHAGIGKPSCHSGSMPIYPPLLITSQCKHAQHITCYAAALSFIQMTAVALFYLTKQQMRDAFSFLQFRSNFLRPTHLISVVYDDIVLATATVKPQMPSMILV